MSEYYVNFYTYEMNLAGGSPGHVYVGFEERNGSDILSQSKVGFYPAGELTKEEAIEGKKEGVVKSDNATVHKFEYIRKVSLESFSKAKEKENEWRAQSKYYKLFESDCVSFAIEIARAVGLNPPRRGISVLTPDNFIDEVKNEHMEYIKTWLGQ